MASILQTSYAKGEVTPGVYGRIDLAAYFIALRTAYNCVIHRFGGVSNRQGLEFVGPIKDHAATSPLIVPFQQKTTDAYLLEFGDEYMRVVRNDAYVLEASQSITGITQASPAVVSKTAHGYSDGDELFLVISVGMVELNGRRVIVTSSGADTFEMLDQITGDAIDSSTFSEFSSGTMAKVFELATPFAGADITDTNILKFVQDADVMTITHKLYAPRELSRTGHTSWTLDIASFGPSVDDPTALACTPNTTGSTTYRYRVTALKRDTLEESLPAVNNTSKSITAATAADPAVFTSASHGYEDGEEVEISGVASGTWAAQLNGKRFFISDKASGSYQLKDQNGEYVDSSTWGAYPGSGVARATFVKITNGNATANNTVSWAAETAAERYRVYKYDNGSYGLIGTTEALSFLDDNIGADLSKSHPRARNPFDGADNYPNCAGFYQQRRVFAGSTTDPDARWFSQTGLVNNMNVSSPLQDDDAITARLRSQDIQEVRWLMPDDDLLEFTSSTEWRTNAGSEQRFSFDTINTKPQTDWGIAFHLPPIKIGDTIIFCEDGGKRVRAFGYSFQQDKYRGPELSLLAAHLLEKYGIVSWAYQRKPEPRVYAVREDGVLLTLTFDSDQEVIAWTRWQTKGKFKRVAVLRNPSGAIGSEDGVYFVVERKVGGQTRQFLEKLSSRIFSDPRDCRFVDSGLSYDNPVTITGVTFGPVVVTAAGHGLENGDEVEFSDIVWEPTLGDAGAETQPDQLNYDRFYVVNATTDTFELTDLSDVTVAGTGYNAYSSGGYVRKCASGFRGFDHLEGESLVGLIDGNVFRDLVVTNGRVDLPDGITAARAHIGLPYKSEVETLDIEDPGRTIQGYFRSIDSVVMKFERTRGLWIGPDEANLSELKMREYENMGDPIELLTGSKTIELNNGWNTQGRILARQIDPVPFTLLSTVAKTEIGG